MSIFKDKFLQQVIGNILFGWRAVYTARHSKCEILGTDSLVHISCKKDWNNRSIAVLFAADMGQNNKTKNRILDGGRYI